MNLYQHLLFLIPALFFLVLTIWFSKRQYCSDLIVLSGTFCLLVTGIIFLCWIINMIDAYDVPNKVHKFYVMLGAQ
jgi:hypothetical protein